MGNLFCPARSDYHAILSETIDKVSVTRDEIADFFVEETFGFRKHASDDLKYGKTMIQAVVAVAAGDGIVSEEEEKWIRGHFLAVGLSLELIEESLKDKKSLSFDEIAESMDSNTRSKLSKKILIYYAIEAAAVDDIAPGEKETILKLAEKLGISSEEVESIIGIVERQESLKIDRIRALGCDKFPDIYDKYVKKEDHKKLNNVRRLKLRRLMG